MAAFNFHRRRTRRWWYAGATLAAAAFFAAFFVVGATANITGSTFEGNDGNMIVNTGGNLDWANVAGLHTATDLPSGSSDNSFGQGTKEDNASTTIVSGSIPPNKNDLTHFMEASQVVGTGSSQQVFLYLGWERLVNIGNANLDFEINKNATSGWTATKTGSLTINRSAGDVLVTYDFGGSGTPTIGLDRWLLSASNPTVSGFSTNTCLSSNTFPCWGDHETLGATSTSTTAEGAVNTGTIADMVFGGSLTAGLFGEASINLTAAGVFTPGQCSSFGSAFLKSRSSSSFTAEIKDFIAPKPVNITNCGEVIIRKETSPRGQQKDFTFNSDIAGGELAAGTGSGVTGATCAEAATDYAGTYTLNDNGNSNSDSTGNVDDCASVPQGTYHISETPDSAYTLSGIDCGTNSTTTNGSSVSYTDGTTAGTSFSTGDTETDITLKPGDVIDCTYTNTLNQGALLIEKDSLKTTNKVLNAGAKFCYTTTAPTTSAAVCNSSGTVVTDLGPSGTVGTTGDQSLTTGLICVKGLPPGTYYLNETAAPTGYGLVTTGQVNKSVTVTSGTNCGANPPTSTTTGKATFNDPPLSDVQINFKDGGSGETSLKTVPMVCTADNSTGTSTSSTTNSPWANTTNLTGVQIGSSDVTVTCTAVIDP